MHAGFWISQCLTVVSHTGHVSVSMLSLVLREHWHQPHVSYTPTKAWWWHFQFLFTLSKASLFDFFKVVDISPGKGTAQNKFSFHQDSNFLSKQLNDFFFLTLPLDGLVEKYRGEEEICYVNSYSEVCKQSSTLLRLSVGSIVFWSFPVMDLFKLFQSKWKLQV